MSTEAGTSEAARRNLVAEVLMEHFGFVPQAFSRRASDLSNEVLYSTMDSIENVVKSRLGSSEDVDKGLYTLETLLENQIDMRLDQYEAYLYRNVFTVQPELLPFIKLDHQPDSLAANSGEPSLDGQDEKLLAQIDDERQALEKEMEENLDLEAASERIHNRALALAAVEEELEDLGWGISKDPEAIVHSVEALEAKVPGLLSVLNKLADTQPPNLSSASHQSSASSEPWSSRESYVQWVSQRIAAEGGSSSSAPGSALSASQLDSLKKDMAGKGSKEDADHLLRLLGQQ